MWKGWKGPKTQAVEEINRTVAEVLAELRSLTSEVRSIVQEMENA